MFKRITTGFLLVLLAGLLVGPVAHGQKIGYANQEAILANMPEMKEVQTKLQQEARQQQQELQKERKELQQKMQQYQQQMQQRVQAEMQQFVEKTGWQKPEDFQTNTNRLRGYLINNAGFQPQEVGPRHTFRTNKNLLARRIVCLFWRT